MQQTDYFYSHILSHILLAPLLGALIILVLPRKMESAIKWTAVVFSGIAFIISVLLFLAYDTTNPNFQFTEYTVWITAFNISYHIGIEGTALLLIGLTTFTIPLALIFSWGSIQKRVKEYYFLFLILELGTLGVFMSLDTILFYVFWEIILIPMYFIIGVWGGERRIYASVKFFLFTIVGSLFMLVAIIWLGLQRGGTFTSDFLVLQSIAPVIPLNVQIWLFLAFALAFCIKIPLFPLHTWLPDAHTEAPTAGSVVLAGLLLKLGTFGLLRYNIVLFPQASILFAPFMCILGIVGIIYGALLSMVQPDMKRVIAYSSVAHLGFVVMGIFSMTQEGMQGAVIQMVNHGLSTGMLFLVIGMLYDRRHTRLISEFGGLARVMPRFAVMFALAMLASVGLPGLNGFVGEFLILLGTLKSPVLHSWAYAVVATTGVIFAAIYLLGLYKRIFFGTVTNEKNLSLKDLGFREMAILGAMMVFIV
ncbi:MAG TPA: NADH-quinone oxidoreductase subunit M, partial [Candidatus Kapabacteria bacterium]|nr:NADH-quinone oxidoreductase subunit M [Candidatus Kapabacteria bacterium]